MTLRSSLRVFFLLFVVCSAYGQKVKYKDIYGLLSTKQYDAAEPFLKKYLRETTDNPNAYLFMGIIFQEKAMKDDMLKNTRRTITAMDSAILFYDKAYKSITEKEIKRNDEFYQAYNRRDLRTGEFGVKLSDIQFDLEKRMEGLRERIDRVKMVKYYFALSDSLYKKCNALYNTLHGKYPGESEFYLRSDEATLKDLAVLSTRFDSCTKAFDNYKSSVATTGKSSYNQVLSLQDISDFKKDGVSPANFHDDDLKIWDYKKFALKSRQTIEAEIVPMREHLIAYDIEINKLREKLGHDSVSVKSDLTSLIDKLLLEKLRKFDQEPLPMEIFTLKIADLEYRSTLIEDRHQKDSTDVHLRLNLLNKEFKYLNKLDSMSTKLVASDLDKRALDYESFVKSTFANATVLRSFVKGLNEYAMRERSVKDEQLARSKAALRWLVNGADSIPLFQTSGHSRFKPLVVMDEKYTAGLHYTDSLSPAGYLYTINATRTPEVKVSFPVEKASFKESRLASFKAITLSEGAGQIYFVLIYSERLTNDNKVSATLAKVYRSDGLAWSTDYRLAFVPREISFKPESGELTIKGENNEQSTIDKNGKLVK